MLGRRSPRRRGADRQLQAGRAIAALSAAYFHSYVALREFSDAAQHPIPFVKDWGYFGFNFFFAISGYAICLVIAKRSFTIRSFFIKRLFRLYPLYWAVMGVCALVIGQPAYAVSWTLERGIVFYVLAELTIPFVGVAGLIVLLAGLAWRAWCTGILGPYHLKLRLPSFIGWPAMAAGATGLGCFYLFPQQLFPFAVTGCLALVLLGMVQVRLPWQHWSLNWLVKVGDASYSIYLLHMIVFIYSYRLTNRVPPLRFGLLCEPWRFATIAACCGISTLTWRYIETPFILLGNRLAERRPPLTASPQTRAAEG